LVKEKLNEALDNIDDIEIPGEDKEDISNFTYKSMETNKYWSGQINDELINDQSIVGNPFAMEPPKCKNCGKALDIELGMPIDGYCSDCRINSALNIGINLEKRCSICGTPMEGDPTEVGLDICSSCMSTDLGPTSPLLNNESNFLLDNDSTLSNLNATGFCQQCGKVLPPGSMDRYCEDCT